MSIGIIKNINVFVFVNIKIVNILKIVENNKEIFLLYLFVKVLKGIFVVNFIIFNNVFKILILNNEILELDKCKI